HTHHDYPGSGIGLAITERIVKRHGGRIWAVSVPDQGTTLLFTLPPAARD
ncbi:MAG: ATP-binding protein, partial [Thiogranum sp.]